ncbi:hypothetical protein [Streptomyces sp. NPDC101150]|uniref:hypothetical protein n=1 Tax=Streptomyces sp. NPDC101150 TaxID=3366114 RepID=UPI0038233F23
MTTDTPAPADTGTAPRHLSPRDESRVSLARSAWRLRHEAHDFIPVEPDAPAGDLLRQALELERLAQKLVQDAVVAERERGTTWEQLAGAAGTTRQSAHERWSRDVQTWANLGRTAGTESPTADRVAFLDQEYARLNPDRTDAVSAGLDATRHPGSAAFEDTQRTRGQQLHARRVELERDSERNHQEYERLKEPTDRNGWLRLTANLTASADLNEATAQVYEELTGAEPTLADEHRASAEKHRGYAADNRKFADLALKRAGAL